MGDCGWMSDSVITICHQICPQNASLSTLANPGARWHVGCAITQFPSLRNEQTSAATVSGLRYGDEKARPGQTGGTPVSVRVAVTQPAGWPRDLAPQQGQAALRVDHL